MKARTAWLACLASILIGFAVAPAMAADKPTRPALRAELLAMEVEDQAVRRAEPPNFERWREVDQVNRERLKAIVKAHGWPTIDMVGADGATAAWIMAQHADAEPEFQREVLRLMEPLVKSGQASAKDYAYLYDRTHVPQRFGTQGVCTGPDRWEPFDIEDIAGVNARRRALGMPTMADYASKFKLLCKNSWHPNLPSPHKTVPVPQE